MCLAVFCSEYFPIDFLGEYINIGFDDGQLQTREVYDVFFRAPADFKSLTLYFLSPHSLLSEGKVSVQMSPTPGDPGVNHDLAVFYPPGPRPSCGFDTKKGGEFWIERPVLIADRVETKHFSGKVLWGEALVPKDIQKHGTDAAIDLMNAFGTLFSITFSGLTAGERYAMRIIVNPVVLLHLAPPLSVDTRIPDQPQTQWKQFATVMDPATCRLRFQRLVASLSDHEAFKICKPVIELILDTEAKYTLPVEHHRIAVLCPPNCDLDVEKSSGDCIAQGTSVIHDEDKNPFMLAEWISGRAAYPHSHPESSSRVILQWLVDWAQAQPKSKEDITTAVEGNHQNVSILVDALEKVGLIVRDTTQPGFYSPKMPLSPGQIEAGLLEIAKDRDQEANLYQRGYQVHYDLTYYFLTPDDKKKYDKEKKATEQERHRNRIGYALGWAGFALAILGLTLTIVQWFLG